MYILEVLLYILVKEIDETKTVKDKKVCSIKKDKKRKQIVQVHNSFYRIKKEKAKVKKMEFLRF